jgi:hypothetical protein
MLPRAGQIASRDLAVRAPPRAQRAPRFPAGGRRAFRQRVPGALGELVGSELGEGEHQVLAGRRETGLEHGRKDRLDVRTVGWPAVRGVVPCSLEVLDRRRDREQAGVGVARDCPFPAGDLGQIGKGDVHLHRAGARAKPADVADDVRRELVLADEVAIGGDRVSVRDHVPRLEQLPRGELDSNGAPPSDDHSLNGRIGTEGGGGRRRPDRSSCEVARRGEASAGGHRGGGSGVRRRVGRAAGRRDGRSSGRTRDRRRRHASRALQSRLDSWPCLPTASGPSRRGTGRSSPAR